MVKKKIVMCSIVAALLLGLGGCGNSDNTSVTDNSSPTQQEQVDKSTQKKDDDFVKPEELPYTMEILPPDIIGTVWGNLTFTNNSKYVIKSFDLTVEYTKEGKRDKTYYLCYDTIMPNESSTVIESFISDDWKPLELEYEIYDQDSQKSRRISYDYKLQEIKGTDWY